MVPMVCFSKHEDKYLNDFNEARDVFRRLTDTINLKCSDEGCLLYEIDIFDAEIIRKFLESTNDFIENYEYFYEKIRRVTNEFV